MLRTHSPGRWFGFALAARCRHSRHLDAVHSGAGLVVVHSRFRGSPASSGGTVGECPLLAAKVEWLTVSCADRERIADLEVHIRDLKDQVGYLRAEVERLRRERQGYFP